MPGEGRFQNIKTPYITIAEQAEVDVDAPVAGHQRLFIDEADQLLYLKDSADVVTPIGAGAPDYILIRDSKTQNTDSGGFTSGAWRTRDLTTEVTDTGNNASLSSNQITLVAGTYEATIICPAFHVDNHQARLQDITNTATLLLGTVECSFSAGNYAQTSSIIKGRFTLAGSTVIEVQHQCSTTRATNGFGISANFTTEIFTVAEFIKVA